MSEPVLSGKVALVSGGARRIGRAIATSLSRAGAKVAITYRNSRQEAEEFVSFVVSTGGAALALPCDVRSESSVRGAISECVGSFGQLDVLVNNAAIFESSRFEDLSVAQWDVVLETNARGPFLLAREAIGHLRTSRGRIVNIGSLGGTHAWAEHAHYGASKAALHMLTRSMAKAFAPEVSVNCVAPGWIEFPDSLPDVAKRFASRTPMRGNGEAEDVADAVMFFASGPKFITGQILEVDGGLGL